jgi:hypothetical protein
VSGTERARAWVRLWPLASLVALLVTARAHAADTEHIQSLLRVHPGATCLTAPTLAAAVEPLLEDVHVPQDFSFVVEGDARDSRGARLRIVRGDQVVAERVFEPGPELCDRLHAAVGLTIALAINAAREEEVERERGREWSLSGAVIGSYGVVPRLAPGAELHVRRHFGEHALLRLGTVGVAGFGAEVAQGAGTFDATLVAARADGCARGTLTWALRGGGCLGLLGGALYAVGDAASGATSATSATVPWLALSFATSLELRLSERWALELGVSATFLLHRVEVGLEDTAGVRQRSRALDRVSFALGLGPAYYF